MMSGLTQKFAQYTMLFYFYHFLIYHRPVFGIDQDKIVQTIISSLSRPFITYYGHINFLVQQKLGRIIPTHICNIQIITKET